MKILLVEDNIEIVEFLKKSLQENGYAVDFASDGKEGFYLATTNTYNLMVFDVMLPFMSGIELVREIRRYKIYTPILILTAKDDSDDIIDGLDSGADDYMTKPFVLKELLARIRAMLRRNQEVVKSYSFKDLSLDVSKKIVTRADKKIELTAKEYAILELLLQNKDSIVSDAMIIESVWDMNYVNASNLVKVYIYRLRNKIDKGFEEKYVHNIKNLGYKLQ